MKNETIIVLGGTLSGPTAACRAREHNEQARILLVERSEVVNFPLCGINAALKGDVRSTQALREISANSLQRDYNIEILQKTEALDWDPTAHRIRLRGESTDLWESYSSLVFALGSASLVPAELPKNCPNVVGFRSSRDLQTIESSLKKGTLRVAVLGAGPMGIEAADALTSVGAEVTLIDAAPRLFSSYSPTIAQLAQHRLAKGIKALITGTKVERFIVTAGRLTGLVLNSGQELGVDLLISTTGVRPRTELFERAGGQVLQNKAIPIDSNCRTSLPDVYACGACVAVPQVHTRAPLWSAQGALADKTSQIAGANAAGADVQLSPALDSQMLLFGESTLGRCGLTHTQAESKFGPQDVGLTLCEGLTAEAYCKHNSTVTLALLWRRSTGDVLGFEALGTTGVDKQIDAAGMSILAGAKLAGLAGADLGYAPQISPLRAPLNVVANLALSEQHGLGEAIQPEEFSRLSGALLVLDLGNEDETERAPLPGSQHSSLSELRAKEHGFDVGREIVTVSDNGKLAWLGSRILRQRGLKKVRYLAGGTSLLRRLHGE